MGIFCICPTVECKFQKMDDDFVKKRERRLKRTEKLMRSKKKPLSFQRCRRDTTKKPPESVEERSDVSSDDLLPSNKHKLKLLAFKSPYSENPPCTSFMPFYSRPFLFTFYLELAP